MLDLPNLPNLPNLKLPVWGRVRARVRVYAHVRGKRLGRLGRLGRSPFHAAFRVPNLAQRLGIGWEGIESKRHMNILPRLGLRRRCGR